VSTRIEGTGDCTKASDEKPIRTVWIRRIPSLFGSVAGELVETIGRYCGRHDYVFQLRQPTVSAGQREVAFRHQRPVNKEAAVLAGLSIGGFPETRSCSRR
jgi:hypothetical protein